MRAPDDLPKRPRRGSGGKRRRRVLIVLGVIVAFVLLTSLRGIASFYTDFLWFDSLGQSGVWSGIVGTQLSLALAFIGIFFVLAWLNLYVADRLAPAYRGSGPEDEMLERYHDLVGRRKGWVRVGVAGVLAVIAGAGVSSEWNTWILFRNGRDFGIEDEQFGRDVGFYVFDLPFLSFVVNWLFASLLIILIVTAVAHYVNGGIRVQAPNRGVTPQVKAHLSLLLAALALVRAADYWFSRFELTTSSRGTVDGALHTNVNADLPVLNLLLLIALAAAVLFVVNIWRRGWVLPAVAVGLWGFVSVAAGAIYPQFVQRFQVQPNELARERPFIERNIEATRQALGLDRVRTERFQPQNSADDVELAGAQDTIRNIRLWDPAPNLTGQTFQQQQAIRDYYTIGSVSADRYMIDGELTQVNIGARSINRSGIPGGGWEREHLGFTHGYGAILAPSGASERGRFPDYLLRDVPVRTDGEEGLDSIQLDEQPGVYFGEGLDGYVMTNTNFDEIDFEGPEGQVVTDYNGEDGVEMGSLWRQGLFGLRFGDINPVISSEVDGDTRIQFNRDILDRVTTLAPFLDHDADPYPVILDGRIIWVVDMYTTTDRYPYAQSVDANVARQGSGLSGDFNYIRNSVKATVDAFDGTVNFYVIDEDDPIADAYRRAFPDLFSDFEDAPEGLEEHLRYPEDLFRVQTTAWSRYHLSDPDDFFTQSNAWLVARDPGTASADPATVVTNEQGQITGETIAPRMSPYYQVLQLPNGNGDGAGSQVNPGNQAEMALIRPFVPFSEDDNRQQLTAFMAARMEPGNYGELVVYETPRDALPNGPGLAARSINADDRVSELETLLDQAGSQVRLGNLLMIPIDDALVYVQPMYVVAESESGELPAIEQVIVVVEDEVVVERTLAEALEAHFGEEVETLEEPRPTDEPEVGAEEPEAEPGEPEPAPEEGEPAASDLERAMELLDEAESLRQQAEDALADGDVGEWQRLTEEALDRSAEANALLAGEETGDTAPDQEEPTTESGEDEEPAPA